MSALFSPPKVDTSAQDAALAKQAEIQAKQEERLKRETAEEQRQLKARVAARRSGGYRSLLSPDREDAMKGLGETLTGR